MREPESRDKQEQVPTPFLYHTKTYPIIAESAEPCQHKVNLKAMHIGEAIKQELENQGKTVVWFAEQLSCHRTNVYRIFEKASIDTHLLIRISKILGHDFFADHSKTLDI